MNQIPNMRGPLGQKDRTPKKDAAYLATVHQLPCCVCDAWGLPQLTPTEAHHARHNRNSQAKTPDNMAIPLCRDHHTGGNGRVSVEKDRSAFEALYGPDVGYVMPTRDKIEAME